MIIIQFNTMENQINISAKEAEYLEYFYTMVRDSDKLQKIHNLSYIECINLLNELRKKL